MTIIIVMIIIKLVCQFDADFLKNMSFLILRSCSPNSITTTLHIFLSFAYYCLLVGGWWQPYYMLPTSTGSRSQWPRGLRRRSAACWPSEIVVSNPTGGHWMFVCCECCVLSGRGLCDELITRPEESYRLWWVVVCDLETSRMRRPWPTLGRSATETKKCVKVCMSWNKRNNRNNMHGSTIKIVNPVAWTVKSLTSTKFKPLLLRVLYFALSCVAKISLFVASCDFFLLPA